MRDEKNTRKTIESIEMNEVKESEVKESEVKESEVKESEVKETIEVNESVEAQNFVLPEGWHEPLAEVFKADWYQRLSQFLEQEYRTATVYPPQNLIFTALEATPFHEVKAVVLGQDPYHGPGQAHGLSFSVPYEVPIPPSLRNIFKERYTDLGLTMPQNDGDRSEGWLMPWARQGVLLLNAILTVRAAAPHSHKGKGWEYFTNTILQKLAARPVPLVFVLWGNDARKKKPLLEDGPHLILESAHPSPLSARNGFFGSKPFSKINAFLVENGQTPINWEL